MAKRLTPSQYLSRAWEFLIKARNAASAAGDTDTAGDVQILVEDCRDVMRRERDKERGAA